jgi:tripartite-type tricarboxylate transporter receptor subunit TctC
MPNDMLRSWYCGFVLLLVAAGAVPAVAQTDSDYPSKPVRIIVTVPAGGAVDTVTRLVAEELRKRLGQPFIVENRGAGAGVQAAEAVALAPPDGYTLMASQPAPVTVLKLLFSNVGFDPAAFEPVVLMTRIPNVLLVRNSFPAQSAQELLAYLRQNPGKVNFASQGTGTTTHLTAELFMTVTGSRLVHVPYRGTAPALNDLAAGHVDLSFMEYSSAIQLHESGRARIIAVAARARLPQLPDIPTLMEAGVDDFVSDTWNALSAPPRTPTAIVAKVNGAANEALRTSELAERLRALNLTVAGGTPAEMGAFVRDETTRWSNVIRRAGITPQ